MSGRTIRIYRTTALAEAAMAEDRGGVAVESLSGHSLMTVIGYQWARRNDDDDDNKAAMMDYPVTTYHEGQTIPQCIFFVSGDTALFRSAFC